MLPWMKRCLRPSVPRIAQRLCTDAVKNATKDAAQPFDIAKRAKQLGIKLSDYECRTIAAAARAGNKDGIVTLSGWERLVNQRAREAAERLTIYEFIGKAVDQQWGQHLLKLASTAGVMFFAVTGAHTAGEAGMHVVGATLVGCVTAMGGGALNQMMMGNTPCGWMNSPRLVVGAVTASVASFYLWPLLEQTLKDRELAHGDRNTENGNAENPTNQRSAIGSAVQYTIESLALSCFAVVGAQSGIIRGLNPVTSIALGVTITFGGVFRDVMCQRDVSLGSPSGAQSYGLASAVGAGAYVALRELHVWICNASLASNSTVRLVQGGIPIYLRILAGAGAALTVRMLTWQYNQSHPDGTANVFARTMT